MALNRVLGAFVNLFRSIPFLILMVALIPFTRLIVGTTYGVWAAVVPLTIAATPYPDLAGPRVSIIAIRATFRTFISRSTACARYC